MRAPLGLAFAIVALGVAAPPAGALTFCAGTSGGDCSSVYPATGAGLQSALDAADTSISIIDPTPNVVRIGPGTYSTADGFATLGQGISIVGAGSSTILTSTTTDKYRTVLGLKTNGSAIASVRGLAVHLPAVGGSGLQNVVQVADVQVTGPGKVTGAGIVMEPGGRVSRVTVDAKFQDLGIGIVGATGVIEDSLIRMRAGGNAYPVYGVYAASSQPGTAELTLRHMTILGEDAFAKGIEVTAGHAMTPATETVHLRDSLIHGVGHAIETTGTPAAPIPPCISSCFAGTANLDSRYSSFDAASTLSSGPGAISAGQGNLPDPAPLLDTSAAPLPGSPLIDAGDPAAPDAGDSATDVAGAPRIAGVRRDIGAVEAKPVAASPAPVPTGTTPPGTTPAGTTPAPVISALRLSRSRFRAGAPPRRGTVVRFTLSATATYQLRIERVLGGRRGTAKGGAKVCRSTRLQRTGRRCTILRTVGTLQGVRASGPVSVAFSGRLAGRGLPPGKYRLTVEARTNAGAAAQPRSVRFSVRR